MHRCPGHQTSDVNETSQGKIEKIRHTDISTLDTRDTSDTDHRVEVGDSCKRVKKNVVKRYSIKKQIFCDIRHC